MNKIVLVAAALLALPVVNFAGVCTPLQQKLPANMCPGQTGQYGFHTVQDALNCGWSVILGQTPSDPLQYTSGPTSQPPYKIACGYAGGMFGGYLGK